MEHSVRHFFSKTVPGLLLPVLCLFSALTSNAQTATYYRDTDGDGWGNPSVTTTAASQPAGYVLNNLDCNDNNSNASAWVNTGNPGFSQYGASYLGILLDASGVPYVAYNDNTTKGSVQKYSGGAWPYVGNQQFTAAQNMYSSFTSSSSGVLYMGYQDNGNQASMMKYNGSSWSYVGNQQFTPAAATYTSMALGINDTPFIAFKDAYYLNGNRASVMKYNGSSWVYVGAGGFSSGTADYTSLAIYGSTLYVAYSDGGNSGKVSVMKSTGGAWTNVGSLGFSAGSASYVSIHVDNTGTPYVAYNDGGNSNKATVMRYNGSSWVNVGTAGFSAGTANYVCMAIDNGRNLYVAYQDGNNSNKATVMKYNGSSWSTLVSAGFTPGSAAHIDIALSSYGVPYLAFQDGNGKASAMNLAPVINFPTTPAVTATPSTTCSSGSVTLTVTSGTLNDATAWTWYSGSCGGTPVGTGTTVKPMLTGTTTYYVRGENGCASSNGVCAFVTATLKPASTWYRDADNDSWGNPSVTTTACTQPAGYVGNKTDCNDAVFTNTTFVALGSGPASTLQDQFTTIAIDNNNVPYIGFYEAYSRGSVMKFSNGSWSYVGNQQFTAGATQYNSIAIDNTGTPYMAYQDSWSGTSVMKYDGSNWVYVGNQNFSMAGATYQSLAIDPSNTPYVAYNDAYYMQGNKATVMSFNGSSWVPVGGTPGITSGVATYISLAIDGGGMPYIAYCDGANSNKATVMKYTGSAWVIVGAAGFSSGSIAYTSLAFDAAGTPYVAYSDGNNGNKVTVMKFNGSSWINVGSAGFSSGSANYTSLAVSGNNLYVSYSDGANSNKATVMRYNGSSWAIYGNAGFSTGTANYTTIAVDALGIPVTAFQDNGLSNQAFAYKAGPIATQPTTPSISASMTTVVCGTTTTLTATGTLNSAGNWYWYSGSCGGNGTFVGTGNPILVNPVGNTTYYARGDGGCLTTPGMCGNITINTTASAPVIANIAGPTTVCEGATAALTDATPGGVWTTSNASKATIDAATGLVYGVSSGGVNITYTISNACGTAFKTYSMNVNNGPNSISGGTDVCEGSTITLNSNGSGTWSSSNTSIATIIAGTGVATGVNDGIATITYTLSNNGCYRTLALTVDPQPGAISGVSPVCLGTSPTFTNGNAGGTWSSSVPANATINQTTGVVTPINSGNTVITYGLPGGCTSTFPLTVSASPNAITGTTSACVGDISALNSSGSGVWSSSSTAIATVTTNGNVTGVSPGVVTISYVLNASGCGTAKTFTVLPSPSAIAGITSVCLGATTTLSNSTAGGTWSSSAGGVATIGVTTGVVTPVSSGNTTITYRIANGCAATTVVRVDKAPSVLSVTNNGPKCAGQTITLSATGQANVTTYLWTGPGTITNPTTNNATLVSPATTASGTYTLTVSSDGTGPGCSANYTTNVTVRTTPTAAPANNGPKCGTGSVTLTANPANGATTFAWAGPSFTSTTQNPSVTPAVTSVYSLTVTDGLGASGCAQTTVYTTTVMVNSLPTAAPTNNGPICTGSTVTLSANPGGSTNAYTWSGPNLSSTTAQNPTATPTATATYSLTVRYGNGLPGCSPATVYTTTVTVGAGSIWLGGTSTAWATVANWCGGVPTTTSVVTIPAGTTYSPIISTGTASVRNITIASGATLLLSGGTIRVSGAISTAGTFSVTGGTIEMNGTTAQTIAAGTFANNTITNLTISNTTGVTLGGSLNVKAIVKPATGNLNSAGYMTLLSTATQTALIDASGTGSVTGNMTMQRYLAKGFGYKYVSSPFTSATVNSFAPYVDLAATFPTFYYYNEDLTASGWTTYTNTSGSLAVMKGYAANFGTSLAPLTYSYSGVANNGALSAALYNHNYTFTQGFNLVGNPYPSPINWTAASGWTKTNVDNAIYYFNASDTDQYTGSYTTYINGVSSDGVATNIIPAMQGFFVHVTNGTYPVAATLGMNNSVRTTTLNPVYHRTSGAGDPALIRVDASYSNDGVRSDPMAIYFNDQANGLFNNMTDALKLNNTDPYVPNLYSLSADEQRLSIQAIQYLDDSTSIVPLGVQTEREGQVTFRARDINEMPQGVHVYFYDTKTGSIQDMRTEPKYTTALGSGKAEYRFYLMFTRKDKSALPVLKGELNAYTSGKSLFVYVISGKGDLVVTNMLGQVVEKQQLNGTGYHEIKLPVSVGIYIATFYSSMGKQSKKIFIGND